MMMWMLGSVALATPPQTFTVTYTVTFDLPPFADQVCGMTQVCDCTVTYEGQGQYRSSSGSRHTFEGTYRKTTGSCHEALELWVPADGTSFHTVELSPEGAIREWVAHDAVGNSQRRTTGIKAGGQVWVAEMAAAVNASGVATHRESETGNAGGISLSSTHTLTFGLR